MILNLCQIANSFNINEYEEGDIQNKKISITASVITLYE